MNQWTYDKTFVGFLTLVFDSYDLKIVPDMIVGEVQMQPIMFQSNYQVITDDTKAERVWKGLRKKISELSCEILYRVFLSEMEGVELLLLNYIRKAFASPVNIELNFGDKDVLEIAKIGKKVGREAERIRMFVRFQKTADDIYYAPFDPEYNVLPLTIKHFEQRFSDQKWVIYDTRRDFGYYYDLYTTTEISFTESQIDKNSGKIAPEIMDEDEQFFQKLWKGYYHSICIRERINPRLQMQFLPKRFWKYLTEKQ
ncbi:MAG: TIGR03915 family putative DNA repair protein [Marinilabiliaceae bacterium]|nr:TIGR03915 family putative DNA repair protein [Marinilabiliaceae bacterium]